MSSDLNPPTGSASVVRSLGIDVRQAPAMLWRVIRLALVYRRRIALATLASVGATRR